MPHQIQHKSQSQHQSHNQLTKKHYTTTKRSIRFTHNKRLRRQINDRFFQKGCTSLQCRPRWKEGSQWNYQFVNSYNYWARVDGEKLTSATAPSPALLVPSNFVSSMRRDTRLESFRCTVRVLQIIGSILDVIISTENVASDTRLQHLVRFYNIWMNMK